MKTLIFKTFCIIALCGFVYAEDDTIDNTLEPDPMPASTSEVEAPANILPSEKPEYDENSLILPGDIPIQPPQLFRNEDGQLVLQVQYTRPQGSQANARNRQPETPAQQPIPELPLLREFEEMNESQRLATLKKAIETVLVANTKRGLNTRDHSPNDVMLMALPYGADARVFQPNPNYNPRARNAADTPTGNSIYSIGALCWNTPLNGKTMLRSDGKKIIARVGRGYQNQPASFAAMVAMSNIMPNYELKVGGASYTIADLLESERYSITRGMNMSMALVAFSFYGESNDQWKNELGETWNVEKMVTSELNRQIDQSTSDVTDWLLGLTAAVKLYESENKPIRGPMALAKRQLKTYHDFVLSIQNDRYLWHPKFFVYKGFNPNAFETMYSGGHIMRWLVFSLSDKELQDHQVRRSVMSLAQTVNRVRPETMANSLSAKQLESVAVSLHALSIYYQRTFGDEPPTRETVAVK